MAWCVRTALLLLPALAAADGGHKVEAEEKQTVPFAAAGAIHIDDSFGDLAVEGWDRAEVEIRLVKKTQRSYRQRDEREGRRLLEQVSVRAEKTGASELRIATRYPSRSLSRPLRGKTNLDLEYCIRVPRSTRLVIHHDIGEVDVKNVAGPLEIQTS
ncbi:MAG: hypothetical protein HY235_22705 [Acidobacteria bacterium]|nr:hypothetical protein [Acidobacteriota bacterium]